MQEQQRQEQQRQRVQQITDCGRNMALLIGTMKFIQIPGENPDKEWDAYLLRLIFRSFGAHIISNLAKIIPNYITVPMAGLAIAGVITSALQWSPITELGILAGGALAGGAALFFARRHAAPDNPAPAHTA